MNSRWAIAAAALILISSVFITPCSAAKHPTAKPKATQDDVDAKYAYYERLITRAELDNAAKSHQRNSSQINADETEDSNDPEIEAEHIRQQNIAQIKSDGISNDEMWCMRQMTRILNELKDNPTFRKKYVLKDYLYPFDRIPVILLGTDCENLRIIEPRIMPPPVPGTPANLSSQVDAYNDLLYRVRRDIQNGKIAPLYIASYQESSTQLQNDYQDFVNLGDTKDADSVSRDVQLIQNQTDDLTQRLTQWTQDESDSLAQALALYNSIRSAPGFDKQYSLGERCLNDADNYVGDAEGAELAFIVPQEPPVAK